MIPSILTEKGYLIPIYKETYSYFSEATRSLIRRLAVCSICSSAFNEEACSCGNQKRPISFDVFQKQRYGSSECFFGVYFISFSHMEELNLSIKKGRSELSKHNNQIKRMELCKGHDFVREWLNSVFPLNGLNVTRITINAVCPPKKLSEYKIYQEGTKKQETLLHGYLKWFAYCFLAKGKIADPVISGIEFEASYCLPGHSVLRRYTGGRGKMSSFRWKGAQNAVCAFKKIADIYSSPDNTIVECGATDALSLVAPIQAEIVNNTIWLPYPPAIKRNEQIEDFNFECEAYLISKL